MLQVNAYFEPIRVLYSAKCDHAKTSLRHWPLFNGIFCFENLLTLNYFD